MADYITHFLVNKFSDYKLLIMLNKMPTINFCNLCYYSLLYLDYFEIIQS